MTTIKKPHVEHPMLDMGREKKIVVVVGATGTGKSGLSVKLAQQFGGEVISADSRQVYRGLDIGSDKLTPKEMAGIPHHLIDVADPQEPFTASEFKQLAQKAVLEIVQRGNIPIVAGGTGFYIDTLLGEMALPQVSPNKKLREMLEQKTTKELFEILKQKDPRRAGTIDPNNKPRLVRAVEIIDALGEVPSPTKSKSPYKTLKIGLTVDAETLKNNIQERLNEDFRKGLIDEVKTLHKNGLSWRRLEDLGLTYRYVALFLQNKISEEEMREKLIQEIWLYAKRQQTYFKRDKEIIWFNPKEYEKIEKSVIEFLDN